MATAAQVLRMPPAPRVIEGALVHQLREILNRTMPAPLADDACDCADCQAVRATPFACVDCGYLGTPRVSSCDCQRWAPARIAEIDARIEVLRAGGGRHPHAGIWHGPKVLGRDSFFAIDDFGERLPIGLVPTTARRTAAMVIADLRRRLDVRNARWSPDAEIEAQLRLREEYVAALDRRCPAGEERMCCHGMPMCPVCEGSAVDCSRFADNANALHPWAIIRDIRRVLDEGGLL